MPWIACSILIILGLFSYPVHAGSPQDGSGQRLPVFVSILPAEYFVQRIGGNRVQAEALVQPGHSPATYAPTPKQMTRLAAASIYFKIGVPFENGLIPKLARTLPGLSIVDLQQGISLQRLEEPAHHEDHDHEEGETDPHTWLDPMLAMRQAKVIRDTLAQADPAGRDEYHANYLELADELNELDGYLREVLAPFSGSTVYVFHPAYGYFCRAYNLRQKAITPGGKEPGAKYIAGLIEQARKEGVRVIFVQPQFSGKAAGTIAKAINGSVVALDPLSYDYIENLKHMARQIALALQEAGK